MTAEEKLVEEVARTIAKEEGDPCWSREYDHLYDYQALARAVIPIVAKHCAEVAMEMTPDLPTHPNWDTGISVGHAISTALESIGKECG